MKHRATLVLMALTTAIGCGSDGATTSGSGGSGAGTTVASGTSSGAGGSTGSTTTSANTFEECQAKLDIDLSCEESPTEVVAFIPGVSCSGSKSFSEDERLSYLVDDNFDVQRIRIAEVPVSPTRRSIELFAPMPTQIDDLPQTLTWEGRITPDPFSGGLTYVQLRPTETTTILEQTPSEGLAMTGNRGTFTMRGGEADVLDQDGEVVTVDTPDADVRGCFDLFADVDLL